jgi:hypothetical protein
LCAKALQLKLSENCGNWTQEYIQITLKGAMTLQVPSICN